MSQFQQGVLCSDSAVSYRAACITVLTVLRTSLRGISPDRPFSDNLWSQLQPNLHQVSSNPWRWLAAYNQAKV